MSRTTNSTRLRAVVAAAAVAVAAVGVGSASAANDATHALTSVSPAYVAADAPGNLVLSGKGLSTSSVATFSCGSGGSTDVTATSATSTTKIVVAAPSCAAGSRPTITVKTGSKTSTALAAGKLTYVAKADAPTISPAIGSWTGNTSATATVATAVPATATVKIRFTAGTTSKEVAGRVATGGKDITFKTPNFGPGKVDATVVVFGIAGAKATEAFEYKSTLKVNPSSMVTGTTAPLVKVDGKGFGTDKSKVAVTVCGVAGTVSEATGKTVKDTSLYFTPPAASAISSGLSSGTGPCPVVVTVTGGATSVVTATSVFTYAAL